MYSSFLRRDYISLHTLVQTCIEQLLQVILIMYHTFRLSAVGVIERYIANNVCTTEHWNLLVQQSVLATKLKLLFTFEHFNLLKF